MKKLSAVLILGLILVSPCFGITFLLKEEALRQVFPEAQELTEDKVVFSEKEIDQIKKTLGGKLVHDLNGIGAAKINQEKEFVFYSAKKEKKLLGTAIIIVDPGKWGPIKFLISLNPQGDIREVLVLESKEIRGRPIASEFFLRQFVGKDLGSPLILGQDIQAVTGATVSSQAAVFAVKKAMALYRQMIEKNN